MIAKKRMIAWLLSLMLVFTMIPAFSAAVYAEDGNGSPAISIGAGNIEKGNKVYMGVRLLGTGPFTESPISWIVLGNANSTDLKNGDETVDAKNARLLITEKTQGVVRIDPDGQSNVWQGSKVQEWCRTFISDNDGGWIPATESYEWRDHFSGLEKTVMLSTSKVDDAYDEWGTSSLDNEQLFFLSAEEVSDKCRYFYGNESRIAYQHDKDETWDWWLRSPYRDYSDYACAAHVTSSGNVDYLDVGMGLGARPAFNFDLTSVLFTSAAVGGKSSGACGADALKEISDNTTNEWKLTLHESSRDGFTASAVDEAVLAQNQGYTSWLIPVTYSGAREGEKEYVSAILCDGNGAAIYYGNIAAVADSSSASGSVDIAIPTGLNAGSYKLHIFNEQVNGDKLSDYASSFETINLEVNAYPPGEPPTGSAAIPTGKTLTYNGKAQTGVAGGTGYTLSGTASAANAGSYEATATLKEGYIWSDGTSELKTISWKINKAANPLKISPKTASVKYKKLKKKTQTLAVTKVIKFTKKLNDKKTYTLVSAKKGSKSFKKCFKINKTTGKVTIKKNKKMKKGTYKVKVKIQALGNSNYKASAVKTVTFKVKVK